MKDFDHLPAELRKLDLSKKEANVYLALLERGPSTVQQLSQSVSLSRPTVYRAIESLEKKDLAYRSKQDKKSYFIASSPDKLLGILRIQRRRAEEQEREFLRIISALQSKYHSSSGANEIKVYQGSRGKKMLLDDLAASDVKNIYTFLGFNYKNESKKLEKVYKNIRTRRGKIDVKEIYAGEINASKKSYIKRKSIPAGKRLFSQNLVIADKVFLFEKDSCFVIEQGELMKMFKTLHQLLWNSN